MRVIGHEFTFQSGDIQINHAVEKIFDGKDIYIPIWWYSNIKQNPNMAIGFSLFTFQSGDIQIRRW